MSAPYDHSCGYINSVQEYLKIASQSLREFAEEIDGVSLLTELHSEIEDLIEKCDPDDVLCELEEIREINSGLRCWGEEQEDELNDANARIKELEEKVEELEPLEDEVEKLKETIERERNQGILERVDAA